MGGNRRAICSADTRYEWKSQHLVLQHVFWSRKTEETRGHEIM